MHARRPGRTLLLALILAPACTSGSTRPAGEAAEAPESTEGGFFDEFEETRDGKWLYERNCSGCHGISGAGDGETALQLGVQPRNFNQGGFSFGNTPDALFRTLSSGIPGRSVMPSFAGTLSEAERWLVVEHVLSLMPPQPAEDRSASIMEVGDRPVVARGKLPPIAEGLPEHPRGLLIGTPEGMSFEYDTEDVRLLAVRLGAFADREDWHDRGGGYLRPLGQVIWQENHAGKVLPQFEMTEDGGTTYRQARLLSTSVQRDGVELAYELLEHVRPKLRFGPPQAQGAFARVKETVRFQGTSMGPAFRRAFVIEALWRRIELRHPFERGTPSKIVDKSSCWYSLPREDGLVECVLIQDEPGTRASLSDKIYLEAGATASFSVWIVLAPDASDATLELLTKELAQ